MSTPDFEELVRTYLDATNRGDHALLRTLILPDFELAMGAHSVKGIENIVALKSPEHVETTLILKDVGVEDDSVVATIEQRVSWKDDTGPPDIRHVKALFSFTGQAIRRVELLG